MKTIIEHLEKELYPWCMLEYRHISSVIGKENLIFTNIPEKEKTKLTEIGIVMTESIKKINKKDMKICILDPFAKEILKPEDAEKYTHFLFGGILGDHPMKKRTEKELTKFLPEFDVRNIGDKQMSTDTAVIVCHKILDKKIPFNKLKFQDTYELDIEEGYSNIFPFRYLIENNKVLITPGLKEYLKDE